MPSRAIRQKFWPRILSKKRITSQHCSIDIYSWKYVSTQKQLKKSIITLHRTVWRYNIHTLLHIKFGLSISFSHHVYMGNPNFFWFGNRMHATILNWNLYFRIVSEMEFSGAGENGVCESASQLRNGQKKTEFNKMLRVFVWVGALEGTNFYGLLKRFCKNLVSL